jgi:dTDP-4-dehydrorhamnose 3,5-epimerase-like enzyme
MTYKLEEVLIHGDPRGSVFEPLSEAGLAGQRNVHVVTTEPGRVRGNHYHERATETVVVCGHTLVRLREAGRVEELLVPPGRCVRLTLPPGVSHAFKNVGDVPNVIVSFASRPHDAARPDVVRDLLIEG